MTGRIRSPRMGGWWSRHSMTEWRPVENVLNTDAKKVGSASEDTHLTPRPPSRIGRLGWVHCISGRSKLVMHCSAWPPLLLDHTLAIKNEFNRNNWTQVDLARLLVFKCTYIYIYIESIFEEEFLLSLLEA